jgi:DNA (cytosine-5)-methyltransferase 1
MKPLNIATIFSGIGAFEEMLKQENIPHKVLFACDNDKFVKQSYQANHECGEWYEDVTTLDGTPHRGKVDVFVGGSPCQSFSRAGLQRGFEDTRGTLFYEFARLVKEIQPKVFIYENVKGLLSHDKGETFKTILATFDELGYSYSYKVLNAVDYGIPQKRQRLFVVGFLDDSIGFDESLFNNIKNKSFKFPEPIKLNKTVFDFLIPEDEAKAFVISDKMRDFIMRPHTFNKNPEIDRDIAVCLLATQANGKRASQGNYYTLGDKVRKLSPRECLRLMGFGDDFVQVVSNSQLYKQTGNSIVVNVLKHLFDSIIATDVFSDLE